jgi:hypothetical protein
MLVVLALAEKVSKLKGLGMTGVSVVANRLAHRIIPLKKQVNLVWEYSEIQDPTYEINHYITNAKMECLLKDII